MNVNDSDEKREKGLFLSKGLPKGRVTGIKNTGRTMV